jgi:hypothetical protein
VNVLYLNQSECSLSKSKNVFASFDVNEGAYTLETNIYPSFCMFLFGEDKVYSKPSAWQVRSVCLGLWPERGDMLPK